MASSSASTSTAEPKVAHPPLSATSYLSSLPELSTARGQFLYSSFSSRKQSNPTGYAGALSWWRTQLVRMTSQALLGDHRLVIKIDDDLRHLLRTHKLGRPASLATVIVSHRSQPVIAEMVNDQSCIPLSTYLASPSTDATSSSGTSLLGLVTRPLGWAASRLLGRASSSSSSTTYDDTVEWLKRQGEYVVVPLIEKATTTLLPRLEAHLIDPLSRLMTLHTFRARFGSQLLDPDAELSTLDVQVLVKHLCDQGYCVQKGEAIKFRPFHQSATSTTPPLTITSSDLSILSLLSTLTQLEAYITSLQTRIKTYQSLATTALSTQQPTTLIKSHLAQKRYVQKILEQKLGARDKLSQVLLGIETATSDNEMIKAMELGADVLREVVGDPEIRLKRVEEVNERLAQGLEDAREINGEILGGAGVGLGEEGEREIEEELRRLRLDDQREGEKAVEEKLEGSGKVPAGEIGDFKEEDEVRVEEKQESTREKALA
ncbi:BZ3500_MvSof-1268-A1-R1_Chr4-3g07318 [Microbotryum saponariae]|uniref:BZ3500_MvSof-1268-A1-R1_Chr4-3g07318 protein n=1 Tax=Microbotryum saponariae TaxID=289078 RepID=A0A2X0LN78_9BASI|nr:BZ3500_MvSof-1268-A1-R1_Chr4-3g07318 [Microbotryum saponariae]SDA06981.1 BZ3501_MvSof-1269-A2-R1_Chr4-2g07027 [Microbotryum saponariae]